jgi:hypothetical protein
MTNVGDPGHIAAHNVLREHVLAEAARFGLTPPTLAGPFTGGEPDHIGAHNALVSAIQDVAAAGGITVTLPDAASLGDPGHVTDHDALTAAVDLIRQADAYNAATGGTVSEFWDGSKMWRTHTFTASGTLNVTKNVGRDFRVLCVGGGGNGGGGQPYGVAGHQGAWGQAIDGDQDIAVGSHAVVVGGPGAASSVGKTTAAGANNAPRITSDITGTMTTYPGANGGDGHGGNPGGPGGAGTFPGGGGGGGGGVGNSGPPWDGGAGGAGAAGVVIVSYEVAPWNSATGGTVNDVDDYNGTGQKWRTHTFTANGTLNVSIAAQPFRILVCGGGGGSGAPVWGQTGGAGGGGAVVWETGNLGTGAHAVTVGLGGPGGNEHGHHSNGPGGTSTLGTITAGGGGEGGTGHDGTHGRAGGPPNGGTGGNYEPYGGGNSSNNPNISSDITGAAVTYGVGGSWVDGNGGATMAPGVGKGGDAHRGGVGDTGGAGVVLVAYRIG